MTSILIIKLKILIHCNEKRIVGTQMKLTQKIDHFTVLKSLPSTSCYLQKFPPNKRENLARWTSNVVLGMLTLGG